MRKRSILLYLLFILLLPPFVVKDCKGYELISDEKKIENYIKKHNRSLTNEQRKEIVKAIIEESSYYDDISFRVVLAIAKIESNFDPLVVGKAGEIGLMQIYTKMCFGIKADETKLFNIQYNISFGICILHNKLRIAGNDIIKAIELYNGSGPEARKYVKKVLNTLNKINKEFD